MSARRPFLGVERSANGLAWTHRLGEREENAALAITQGEGLPDIVARILAGRGVQPGHASAFLDPTIRALLPDPASLTGMEAAANRIARAALTREPVAIFGDYDVDGAASSALLKRFLDHYGAPSEIYIPDRIFEGYGPNPDAMRDLARRARLIVTVDCGTNSGAAIDAAVGEGADVVVLDHHQPNGALPGAALAIVNPNRQDDLSGQGHLCAAGVVFLTLVQVSRILRIERPDLAPPDLLSHVDLVGLATVCDVVPLTGINRAFVVKGLAAARLMGKPGLRELAALARIGEPLSAHHFGFMIGPRINAGGRIGDAALGSRLLATDDPSEARVIAEKLDQLNQERQAAERIMLAEALAEAEAELAVGDGPSVIVTARDSWHPGIVGLLASRLKDATRRPAIAIAFNANGIGTGSGRSISGFDLGSLIRAGVEAGILVKGGGHSMAAGLTIERGRLGDFRAFLEARAAATVSALRSEETLAIDAALSAEGATFGLLDMVERCGPFGTGHPAPVFALPRHRIVDLRPAGVGHMRVTLASERGGKLQAMAFRAEGTPLGDLLTRRRGQLIHAAGALQSNHWNGMRSVQFRLTDARAAD